MQQIDPAVSFVVFLLIGMIGMFAIMLYIGRMYNITPGKVSIAAGYLTIVGVIATYLMAFLESGSWGGRSFFGAVFLVPVFMFPMAKLLKIKYGDLLDICAPAGCIMLSILKIKCSIDGCCYGRLIITSTKGFRFPSQITESIAAIILMIILVIMLKKGNNRGIMYAWFLFLYGIIRFILNLFRETTPWIGPLPQGNVWALLSLVIGFIIIMLRKKEDRSRNITAENK